MKITGKTKKIGIIGWPVEHSFSPAIQNAAFSALNINYVYVPLAVQPGKLKDAISGLKALDFTGANVTIPYKVAVMEYLDIIDQSAQQMGAVNTIVVRDGLTYGYNTDSEGYMQSLRAQGVTVAKQQAVILGAGGAARAVVRGLLNHGIERVTVVARNEQKATEFLQLFTGDDYKRLSYCPWQTEALRSAVSGCRLLINSTSLGMSPHIEDMPDVPWDALLPQSVVSDLVYNPLHTRFLQTAAKAGHTVVTGDGMLIGQGALAFSLWTGLAAPIDIMHQAFHQHLLS